MKKISFGLPSVCALTSVLCGCITTPPPVNLYDFGTTPSESAAPACNLPPLYLADISSTAVTDSNLMLYRLLYDNDQQTHAYASHRWSMTPAQLLALRIKAQLAGNNVSLVDLGMANPNGWQLRLDLNDFTQNFSDATHSYAQIEVRASVLRANQLVAQTTLKQRADAASPDAPSGARSMRTAADALITDLNNWLCKLPR